MLFEVACCLALGDAQVYHHLLPISKLDDVSKIWVVRHKKVETGIIPKAEYILVSKFKLLRFVQMFFVCRKLAKRENLKYFVSFNPLPYGLIAFFAKMGFNKRIHLGFIGSDWYRDFKKYKLFNRMMKKADFITATGDSMINEMVKEGFDSSKIKVLPHCIDVSRFEVVDPLKMIYDCIFVGQLIHRKRVDVIINAIAEVKKHIPKIRLCIVGTGELELDLKELARNLDLSHNVDFVGYTNHVQEYLSKSKLFVMASDMEGFPFAIVESLCSGLPVLTTSVGTIADFIKDSYNGFIFEKNNHKALAEKLKMIIGNQKLYEKLRGGALETRDVFKYENASNVWVQFFKN